MDNPNTNSSQPSKNGLIGAILFAAVMISGSLIYLGSQAFGSAQISLEDMDVSDLEAKVAELKNRVTLSYDELVDDDPYMGDADAPVAIIEFSDHGCFFCRRHNAETIPRIKEELIDTGKVKYVFRNLPFRDMPSAHATNCAFDQGGNDVFFQMSNQIFHSEATFDTPAYVAMATSLGLDGAEFESCLTSQKYQAEIQADVETASNELHFDGTPAFVVTNGTDSLKISGALPYENFKAAVDALSQ